ncbi:MAG: cellulase family glycosylhydrolase [Ktedonobacteraceae bacterium]
MQQNTGEGNSKGYMSTTEAPPPTGMFRVRGNKIYDPQGKVFIVKGMTAVYGRFIGDANGFGLTNYIHAQRDLDAMRLEGVNLVRIFVSATSAHLPPGNSHYIADYMQELDNVVLWTTQRGMVAEITNSLTHDFNESLQFVKQLADRYKSNRYVWIGPMNEPNCNISTGDPSKCSNWAYWQQQQRLYIQAIRRAGMTSPIVVNAVDWSRGLGKIASYPLNDSNIIYAAHRYPDAMTNFTFNAIDQADCDSEWADLTAQFPIIVEEVGIVNDMKVYPAWGQAFMNFVSNWVKNRGGAGAVGFVYYWSDGNSMTGEPQHYLSNGVRNQWGEIFYESYLTKVG